MTGEMHSIASTVQLLQLGLGDWYFQELFWDRRSTSGKGDTGMGKQAALCHRTCSLPVAIAVWSGKMVITGNPTAGFRQLTNALLNVVSDRTCVLLPRLSLA